METPDILNSKIKKIRIELPHYRFSHSSASRESQSGFVGRKDILKKVKELVQDANDKVGVYLITGARGVGKSNLIDEVIRDTSFRSGIIDTLKYLFMGGSKKASNFRKYYIFGCTPQKNIKRT